ncbi:hypothetical protein D9613_008681 [Agrocybe pediades]|uniref:SHSP domain-containing protein n=1 Tax=Agrocybe pediades TaxID=84607 RepID=A0A8H4QTC2_9AGAR|nr:hypothetical protein D9613_008681 [Agrocybe pediades]
MIHGSALQSPAISVHTGTSAHNTPMHTPITPTAAFHQGLFDMGTIAEVSDELEHPQHVVPSQSPMMYLDSAAQQQMYQQYNDLVQQQYHSIQAQPQQYQQYAPQNPYPPHQRQFPTTYQASMPSFTTASQPIVPSSSSTSSTSMPPPPARPPSVATPPGVVADASAIGASTGAKSSRGGASGVIRTARATARGKASSTTTAGLINAGGSRSAGTAARARRGSTAASNPVPSVPPAQPQAAGPAHPYSVPTPPWTSTRSLAQTPVIESTDVVGTTRSGLVRTASVTSTGKSKRTPASEKESKKKRGQSVRFSEEPTGPPASTAPAASTPGSTLTQIPEVPESSDSPVAAPTHQAHSTVTIPSSTEAPALGITLPSVTPTEATPQRQPQPRVIRSGPSSHAPPQARQPAINTTTAHPGTPSSSELHHQVPAPVRVDRTQVHHSARHHPYRRPTAAGPEQTNPRLTVQVHPIATDWNYDVETHTLYLRMDMPGVRSEDIEVTLATCWWNRLKFLCVRGQRWPWNVGFDGRESLEWMKVIRAEVAKSEGTAGVAEKAREVVQAEQDTMIQASSQEDEGGDTKSAGGNSVPQDDTDTSKSADTGRQTAQPEDPPVGAAKGKKKAQSKATSSKQSAKAKGKQKTQEVEESPVDPATVVSTSTTTSTGPSTSTPGPIPVVATSSFLPASQSSDPPATPAGSVRVGGALRTTRSLRDPQDLFVTGHRQRKYGRMEHRVQVPAETMASDVRLALADGVLYVWVNCGPPLDTTENVVIPLNGNGGHGPAPAAPGARGASARAQ